MPKRTLSNSSAIHLADVQSASATGVSQLREHPAKFYRLLPSPSSLASYSAGDGRSPDESMANTQSDRRIQCSLPPHPVLTFDSLTNFELHLYSHHTNRCASCGANFPTAHLLDIHGTEMHDPLAAARKERGEKIYACLIAGCEKLCGDRFKRRRHMIDKHTWRKDYDWGVVERGIDGRRSALKASNREEETPSRRRSLTGEVRERGVRMMAGFPVQATGEGGSVPPPMALFEHTVDAETVDEQQREDDVASDRIQTTLGSAQADKDAVRVTVPKADEAVDALTYAISSLGFVPPSVLRNQGRQQKKVVR